MQPPPCPVSAKTQQQYHACILNLLTDRCGDGVRLEQERKGLWTALRDWLTAGSPMRSVQRIGQNW